MLVRFHRFCCIMQILKISATESYFWLLLVCSSNKIAFGLLLSMVWDKNFDRIMSFNNNRKYEVVFKSFHKPSFKKLFHYVRRAWVMSERHEKCGLLRYDKNKIRLIVTSPIISVAKNLCPDNYRHICNTWAFSFLGLGFSEL